MFRLFKVRGASMVPTLKSGDIVLLRKRKAWIGNIVLVDHDEFGLIIKRIDDEGQLSGDGAGSTPSETLGAYNADTLIGVAVLAITPSGLRRLSSRRSANRVSD